MLNKIALRKKKRRLIIFLFFVIFLVFFLNFKIRPVVKSAASNRAHIIVSQTVSEAVLKDMAENKENYSEIMEISKNDTGEIIEFDSLSEYVLSSESRFRANSKAELYIGSQQKRFSHFEIRNYETLIPQNQDPWEIYILVETFIVFHKLYNIEENNRSNNDRLVVELIEKNSHGQLVSIPRWTIFLIQSLRRQKRDSIYMSINSAIKDNKIYLSVLVILRRMQIDGIM